MFNQFRTQEEWAEVEERAAANRAWMARVYAKPKPQPVVLGALHRAIIAGDLAGVRQALNATTVNQVTVTGLTPLHLGVFGYARVVETASWQRATLAGKQTVQEQIVDLLLDAGARVDAWDHAKRLPAACCEGKRLPAKLAQAMAAKIEETAVKVPGDGVVRNAFLTNTDITPDSQRGRRP